MNWNQTMAAVIPLPVSAMRLTWKAETVGEFPCICWPVTAPSGIGPAANFASTSAATQ